MSYESVPAVQTGAQWLTRTTIREMLRSNPYVLNHYREAMTEEMLWEWFGLLDDVRDNLPLQYEVVCYLGVLQLPIVTGKQTKPFP